MGAPLIALEVGSAQRGEAIPTAIGRSATFITYPAIAGLCSTALITMFPQMRAIGLMGGMAAYYPDMLVQDTIIREVRKFTEASGHVRKLETGGWYEDTMLAQQARARGISEMSGALGISRAYLGQEASLMHR